MVLKHQILLHRKARYRQQQPTMNTAKPRIKPKWRKKAGLDLFAKYKQAEAELHRLSYVFWECTLRCNLNCIHCGSDCTKDSEKEDMPAADFLKVAERISKACNPNEVMIAITGGEPLVRKDMEEVGLKLNQMGFPWGMVSNGLLVTKERLDSLIAAGMGSLTISLDGLQDNHNWLRGRGFEKTFSAIELALKRPEITFDVVTCVNQRSIKDLPELKAIFIEMGLKDWRIFDIDPIGRAKENEELSLTPEQIVELMTFMKETRKEGKINVNYGCGVFVGNFEGDVRDEFSFCRAGIQVGSVLVDGSISACPNNSERVVQGNIYKDDFIDVWNNKYQMMRDRSWSKTGACASCEAWKWCQGNGMHLWDFEKNETSVCHYNSMKQVCD